MLRGGVGRHGWSWAGQAEFPGMIEMEKLFLNFNGFEICKTLGNSTRRFKRNLDLRVFPKFF
jgi:hypothetical protein